MPQDACHAPGCGEVITTRAFCPRHCRKLPRTLQQLCRKVSAGLKERRDRTGFNADHLTPEEHARWLAAYHECVEYLRGRKGSRR